MKGFHVTKALIISIIFFLFGFTGPASAELMEIGTATYLSSDYKLIYEDDQGLLWLDYTNPKVNWDSQVSWADGLNGAGVLTYNLNPGINISWGTSEWRLPSLDESALQTGGNQEIGFKGPDQDGKYDYYWGYNMYHSEMAHLFYQSLGNAALVATDGTDPNPERLNNGNGPFTNLEYTSYWTGTVILGFPKDLAWVFHAGYGGTYTGDQTGNYYDLGEHTWGKGMAVRSAEVSSAPVPEPSTMLLLGTGLIGLAGWGRRKFRKN